ncbi:hypothetical protein [Streptomyces sp. NPDC058867]
MAGSGYFHSCEEHGPAELVERARMAEPAGVDVHRAKVMPGLRG